MKYASCCLTVIIGHRAVYKATRILHRDISINNIMFYLDKSGVAVGVVCDWDIAKQLHESQTQIDVIVRDAILSNVAPPASFASAPLDKTEHSVQQPTAADADQPASRERRYRTGTVPFMALDLLVYKTPPQHLYRHDLESFFYILVWFLAGFKPDEKKIGRIHEWYNADFQRIGREKGSRIKQKKDIMSLIEAGDETYTEACGSWVVNLLLDLITPLTRAFDDITDKVGDAEVRHRKRLASASASADLLVELVRDAVRPLVIKRESILTYKTFMACLGEEVGDDD